jgi:16S rRNA (guanine1207-N2)-methyltransferase
MLKSSYEITSRLRHEVRTFHSAGGLFSKDKIAKSTRLLVDQLSPRAGDRILDYGCGYGAVGIALAGAAPDLEIQMVDSDIRAVRLAQLNVQANRARDAHVVLDHTLNRFRDGHFDLIALNPPVEEGTETIFEMVERAQSKMRHGAQFFMVAKANRGARSYMRKLNEIIGPAKVVQRSGGYWVMRAERSAVVPPDAVDLDAYEHVFATELRGRRYTFLSRAGVFSRKEVDQGTRLLIETMDVRPRHSIIDVGCGYGPIGITAAHLASVGRVVMVDCNARAVECATQNIQAHHLNHARKNGKPRVEAVLGDRFDAVPGERFDRVVSNPPFHSGSDVLLPLIDEAYAHLRVHGRVYLVIMRYAGIKRHMMKIFGNCQIAADDGRYVVLVSERTL